MKFKKIEIDLEAWQVESFFKPIRKKKEIIILLMEVMKLFTIKNSLRRIKSHGKVILHVSKMSRLFFVTKNKIFSINLPFLVTIDDENNIEFTDEKAGIIDSKKSSIIISLINEEKYNSDTVFDFIEPLSENGDIIESCGWKKKSVS